MNKPQFICFGEILWDVFPDQKHLGGAPLNVALRLASLCGQGKVSIISALGNDMLAADAMDALMFTNLDTRLIQQSDYPTGFVKVTLSKEGNASYQITQDVAWDFIEETTLAIQAVSEESIFVFGSLAARSKVSLATLNRLLAAAPFKVFDVNLRAPFYSWEGIFGFLRQSNFVKMNDEELDWICEQLEIPQGIVENQLKALQEKIGASYLCVTLGANGACILFKDQFVQVPGVPTKVVDTVGAGDSFLATLLWALFFREFDLKTSLDYACSMGSLVASQAGANPKIDSELLEDVAHKK